MPDRVDGFLAGKAQSCWPRAMVFQREAGDFELVRPGEPTIGLGSTFKAARMALYALIRAHRRDKATP